jgi:hypothetical protein
MKLGDNTKPIASWFACEIDEDDIEFEWEYLLGDIDEILRQVNPDGYWHCFVENFGWRSTSGQAYLKFNTAQEMISKVLPNCECSFRVFQEDKVLKIQNYHHDSPVGNEWYKLVPITYEKYEENRC